MAPPAAASTATRAVLATASSRTRMLSLAAGGRPIIDFLEQLVVLSNLRVVGRQFERLLVGLARFVQLSLVLVRDRQVVVRLRVGRIKLDGFFPAVNRFAPEAAL